MKRVQFTEIAENSLFEIAVWTLEDFGGRRADVCQRELVDKCVSVARGDGPSQSCSVLIGSNLAANMRFAPVGAYVVVFVDSKDEIVVIDFVHQREDLAGKVMSMGKRGAQ